MTRGDKHMNYHSVQYVDAAPVMVGCYHALIFILI